MSALETAGYPPIVFPVPGAVAPGMRQGRNVYEGYQRGASLEYGDMSSVLDKHPLFLEAMGNARGRSIMANHRIKNLFLIIVSALDKLEHKNCI